MGFIAVAGLITAAVGVGLAGTKMGMDMSASGKAQAAGAINAQVAANAEEEKVPQAMMATQTQGAQQVSQDGDAMIQMIMASLGGGDPVSV